MKRLLSLFLISGLVACATVANAQNLLTNPNLNVVDPAGTQQLGPTPADWIVAATRGADPAYLDAVSSEGFADHDGGGSGLFFKAFTGNPPWDPTLGDVDADFYQDYSLGVPGRTYTLTGWAGAEDNYSGLNTAGEQSFFAIDFLDAGNAVLGSASLGLEGAGLGDPTTPGLNYEQFSVSGVAPAGTTTVRARVTMLDGVFFQDPGQAFVVDEFSLVQIPEPTSMMLGVLSLLGIVGLARRR